MYELANQYMRQVKVPKVLINGAISVLRKSVQKKGNFDIRCVGRSPNIHHAIQTIDLRCAVVLSRQFTPLHGYAGGVSTSFVAGGDW
jgi:hypothetical protein